MENPTSDEKVMAALAHASVLFSLFGPIGPTLIWVFQRNKSKYVRFHALQAMGYQAFALWGWLIGIFIAIFGAIILGILIDVIFTGGMSTEMPLTPFIIQPIMFLLIFGLWGLFFLVGFIAAILCMINRDFRYPIIGHWLKSKLFDDQNTEAEVEDWEDNWVSGVCHSTTIIQFWGAITPFIIWFSQKERSSKIRFHALQAVFYQLIAAVAYMVGMFGYMFVFFLFFATMFIFGAGDPAAANNVETSPILGIITIIFMGGFMIFWLFFMIAGPIYYLIAAIASILTIRGKNFRYPILGSLIARRINTPKPREETPV